MLARRTSVRTFTISDKKKQVFEEPPGLVALLQRGFQSLQCFYALTMMHHDTYFWQQINSLCFWHCLWTTWCLWHFRHSLYLRWVRDSQPRSFHPAWCAMRSPASRRYFRTSQSRSLLAWTSTPATVLHALPDTSDPVLASHHRLAP